MKKDRKTIGFRVDEELENAMNRICKEKNQSTSTFVRQAVEKAIKDYDNSDEELERIKQAVREVINPGVERLAKINAKTSQMTATSFFLSERLLTKIIRDDEDKLMVYIDTATKLGNEYLKTNTPSEFIKKGATKMSDIDK